MALDKKPSVGHNKGEVNLKMLRFAWKGQIKHGLLENDKVREITGSIYGPLELNHNTYDLEDLQLLAPCEPSKVVCVGLNYQAHFDEFTRERIVLPEEPVLFLKPPTAVIGPKSGIIFPKMSKQVDYEGELAVVIGQEARGISDDEASQFILGYTCGNDVTARDLQKRDQQWTRAKGFDTFMPLGPWIETEINPGNLNIQAFLNDELKQDSNTSRMIFPVPQLVSFISHVMTLLPGDVILTGTPAGVGPMKAGDVVKVVVEGIGSLQNHVV